MGTTFDSLTIGTSGLAAAQRGVETAGQNIANMNTVGYSRQRVEFTPDSGPVNPAFFAKWEGAGRGIRSADVVRLRDEFLDRRAREETSQLNYLNEVRNTYVSVERVYGEPGDTGLASVLDDFYAALDDVANQPSDNAARVQAIEKGVTLTTNLRSLDTQLGGIGDIAESRLATTIDEVNTAARQIADMQASIRSASASGLNVNELMDQRDLLVKGIAEKVGGRAQYEDDGTVTFFIGSRALVRGDRVEELTVADNGPAVEIRWSEGGQPAALGGRAEALLETRNEIVPSQRQALADIADQLRTDFNAQHNAGFDRNGAAGLDFFTVGAGGIEVNAAIRNDPALIAAASTPGTLDGSNALALAEVTNAAQSYRELIVDLGVQGQSAIRRADLQAAVVEQVDAESESAHGVNLDEELTDLVRFQRAYEANSRFINVVDSLLDVLVNRTGV